MQVNVSPKLLMPWNAPNMTSTCLRSTLTNKLNDGARMAARFIENIHLGVFSICRMAKNKKERLGVRSLWIEHGEWTLSHLLG